MKFFAAFIIMIGFAMTSFAQGTSTNHITGDATVVAQVLVSPVTSLEFGNVTPGFVKTISTLGTVVVGGNSGGGNTPTAGKFTVTKSEQSQVTLTWLLPENLTKTGGVNMPISFADYSGGKCGAIVAGAGPTTTAFTPGAALAISTGAFNAAFTAGTFDVLLGGTVTPANAQATGAYTADITLTATYN